MDITPQPPVEFIAVQKNAAGQIMQIERGGEHFGAIYMAFGDQFPNFHGGTDMPHVVLNYDGQFFSLFLPKERLAEDITRMAKLEYVPF